MPKTKVEVYDKDQLIYPFIESDHVTFSNGMKVSEMLDQSISMPTVTHEDLSFKVGVGDQDVSSAIVDSSASEMTIKGKTYQNILPEPSTHVLTNNKEMFKVNEGLDPNVEIVDGVSKSAILKGQTLVNLCENSGKNLVYTQKNTNVSLQYKMKNNQMYYMIVNVKSNTLNKNFRFSGWTLANGATPMSGTDIGNNDKDIYSIGETGIKRFKTGFTDIESLNGRGVTITFFTVDADGTGSTGVVTTGEAVFDVMFFEYQEGMENWDIPYFEGMQSVKMPVLTTTGKNLVDLSTSIYGEGYNNVQTDFIKINPNKTFIASMNNQYGSTVTFYTQNKEPIITINGFKVTSPSNAYYLRWVISTQDRTADWNSFQIEEGAVATSYEPYKTNILSCELTPLNQSMFEQGSFSESTPANTQSYENIKLNSGSFYNNRIRTKGTYKVVKGATYSGQLNNGYGIFICYCKNGLYSAKDKGWIDETNFTFTVPNDCDEMFFALKKTDNSAITPSDYSRIGLKIHQEVVLRSLPNGVKDTLNLMTGEYVQRIGEVILDGSDDEQWRVDTHLPNNYKYLIPLINSYYVQGRIITTVVSNKFPSINNGDDGGGGQDVESVCINGWAQGKLNLSISKTKLNNGTVDELKQWLSQNPVTVQYQLATESIKTVDLSSSGNWDMITLNGSEEDIILGNLANRFFVPIGDKMYYSPSEVSVSCSSFGVGTANTLSSGQVCAFSAASYYKGLMFSMSNISTVDEFKKYLKSNPMTIVYKLNDGYAPECGFAIFSNGHIIQSSGADNSLIPTLDYQAKTSNSYVMDLMKANTRYTMKAKSASGTFTIDGTSYGAGINGTFTTPSSMTNKFLVMSNKTNTEVMILEGDVTSKAIPYFKGIKSAFEGEDKIEVLSTSQNILDTSKIVQGDLLNSGIIASTGGSADLYCYTEDFIPCPNIKHPLYVHRTIDGVYSSSTYYIFFFDEDKRLLQPRTVSNTFTIPDGAKYLRIMVHKGDVDVSRVGIMVTNSGADRFNQSVGGLQNSTKIPLLSPLRSLPNGVCDEIILDREKNKATLIQRIDKIVFDGRQRWLLWNNNPADVVSGYIYYDPNEMGYEPKSYGYTINDRLPHNSGGHIATIEGARYTNYFTASLHKSRIGAVSVNDTTANTHRIQQWYTENPMTMYYELSTPVITEVDLEGFPYIYKDGHIFLNSEIVPTTEIIYSINQSQQISASNEDIIRHEKELTYLQKLIAQYVQVDYESALLSLKV